VIEWDLASGEDLMTLEGHTDSVSAVAYTPDGKQIISGSDDRTLRIWDAANGKLVRVLRGAPDEITAIALSPNGKKVAVASKGMVQVWALEKHP